MKTVTKALDPQGRILVPRAILDAAGMKPGSLAELYADSVNGEPAIVISVCNKVCVLCNSTENLSKVGIHQLCGSCAGDIAVEHAVKQDYPEDLTQHEPQLAKMPF